MLDLDPVLGLLWLAAIVGPPVWAAARLRRRWWPVFAGSAAALADAVVGLAWVLLVCVLLGSLGAFAVGWVAAACVVSAVAVGVKAGAPSAAARASTARRPTVNEVAPAAVGVGLVAVGQLPPTLTALRGGIANFDSLAYHLPKPARWVQEGSLDGVHQIYPGSLFPYYPSASELVHGVGMLAYSSDVLSPLVNVGFIALMLLAAWCIGEARDVGPVAVAALCTVLTALHFSQAGGGTAVNDIPQAALILAALALLARSSGRPAELLPVALAGGLAVGTKPTAALAVAAIAVAAIVRAPAEARLRAAGATALGLLVGGGFWYVRNLLWIGTPIPGKDIGPLETPEAEQVRGSTFVEAVRAGQDPVGSVVDALGRVIGPAWPLLSAIVLAGLLLALARGRAGWERAGGIAGLATLAFWPFTPFTMVVEFAVRYTLGALALGAVLLAVAPALSRGRARPVAAWGFAAVAAVGVLHQDPLSRPYVAAAMAGGLLVAGGGLLAARGPGARRLLAGTVVAALVLASVPVASAYVRNRYSEDRFTYTGPEAASVKALADWARDVDGARIGIEGGELQYPLFGQHLTNHVQYIGRERPDGGYARIESCGEWRRAVEAGRYDYVVTVPWGTQSNAPLEPSPHGDWTAAAGPRAAALVLEPGPGVRVFRITGPLDPSACGPE